MKKKKEEKEKEKRKKKKSTSFAVTDLLCISTSWVLPFLVGWGVGIKLQLD